MSPSLNRWKLKIRAGGFSKDERFWKPTVDANENGFAIIRFLPAPGDEPSPYVKTFSHGFKMGNKWFIEDCPTTVKKDCPVCEANSELWNTEVKANQEIVRKRKRKITYIANVLVIQDAKQPENEGKVFLYRFGSKIFGKLMGAIKPEFEDEVSFNPFDFWKGANFKVKIRKHEGFRNYDKCEFDACGPLFDEDAELERVWKCEHSLKGFLDESNFKSYDEIEKRFNSFVNPTTRGSNGRENLPSKPQTPSAPVFETPTREETSPADGPAPAPAATADDDFAMFSSMIDD